jgi:hypothetical protein
LEAFVFVINIIFINESVGIEEEVHKINQYSVVEEPKAGSQAALPSFDGLDI